MTDRTVKLRLSKDGAHNFQTAKERPLGAIGDFNKKVKFKRLGQYTHCVVEVSISGPIKRDLYAASIKLSPCDS